MLLRGREGLGISVRFFFPCYSFYFTGLYEMRGVLFGLARNLRSCRVWHVDMGRHVGFGLLDGRLVDGMEGRKSIAAANFGFNCKQSVISWATKARLNPTFSPVIRVGRSYISFCYVVKASELFMRLLFFLQFSYKNNVQM